MATGDARLRGRTTTAVGTVEGSPLLLLVAGMVEEPPLLLLVAGTVEGQEVCVGNPGLLRKRKLLVAKPLSKAFNLSKESLIQKSASGSDDTPAPKRRKSSQDIRDKRMKEIEEDLSRY